MQDYKFVGKLAGRFYDAAGAPTAELARAQAAAARAAADAVRLPRAQKSLKP